MTARFLAVLAVAASMIAVPPATRAAPPQVEQLEENLPVPPIPPDSPPIDVPAPVPDTNLQAPTTPAEEGPVLKPVLNARAPTLPGGDPVPGTLYRSDQEQKRQFIPNPGIQLIVPLQK